MTALLALGLALAAWLAIVALIELADRGWDRLTGRARPRRP